MTFLRKEIRDWGPDHSKGEGGGEGAESVL